MDTITVFLSQANLSNIPAQDTDQGRRHKQLVIIPQAPSLKASLPRQRPWPLHAPCWPIRFPLVLLPTAPAYKAHRDLGSPLTSTESVALNYMQGVQAEGRGRALYLSRAPSLPAKCLLGLRKKAQSETVVLHAEMPPRKVREINPGICGVLQVSLDMQVGPSSDIYVIPLNVGPAVF